MEQSYSHQVLIVGHTPEGAALVADALEKDNCETRVAASGAEAMELLKQDPYDVLITDTVLADIDGSELIRFACNLYSGIAPIVVTQDANVRSIVDAIKCGALDVLTPVVPADLRRTVQQVLQRRHRELGRESNAAPAQEAFTNMIGDSTCMQDIFRLIQTIGKSNSSVLITGETGTGKELVAKAIHACSTRKNQNIVSLNCGAIPENLLESELFGHTKGAFTGAHQTRIGRFEQAHKGTLFLNEVGNMSPALQVKLLRVLQEREFERVGGSEKIKVDVRIIAATSAKLSAMVKENQFRMDLYYRLNVIPVHMPPLRERRQDIPLLAKHFVQRYCGLAEMDNKTISQDAMKVLMNCSWPGNVRQLENAIERAVALMGDMPVITSSDLPPDVQKSVNNLFLSEIYIPDEGLDFNTEVSAFERQLILESLKKTGGSRNEAAKLLQLKRTTLVEKLKRLTADTEDDLEEQLA
jgi:DNA-binding NtrC family response regulator